MIQDYLGKRARIADTAYVHESAVLIGDVKIGEESSIWPNTTLRGDDGPIHIGTQTSIQDGTVIHCTTDLSWTEVGDRVTVGHGVILHGCKIANDCLIGMGSIILDGAIIETGAIIGAGSMIPAGKTIPADTLVIGNPFRIIRTCTDNDRLMISNGWKEYVQRCREYRGLS